MAAESPLSAVATPTMENFVPEMVTVLPTARLFSLAYALSTTATAASVSVLLNVRPVVILDEVSGPSAGAATSVPNTE